jgi:lipopolysaccharide/colanic/teichoic acid biosynthesis glycosyltransferase
LKHSLDLVASAVGLVLFTPLLLVLALAVWIASGRPILFRQQRVGWHGREFRLLKFRSMAVSGQRSEIRGQKSGGPWSLVRGPGSGREAGSGATFDAGDTTRVTPIGRFLRKTKLDELPQLWNVVRGDMSLVGPRPEVRKWVDAYPGRWAFVHTVRPGITDPASIRFRNEEEILAAAADPEATYREVILPQKLELYEEYVRRQSFWGDVRIILLTIVALFRGK